MSTWFSYDLFVHKVNGFVTGLTLNSKHAYFALECNSV